MINLSKKEKSAVVFTKNNVFESVEPYFCGKWRESYEAYSDDCISCPYGTFAERAAASGH
jgi:hypothetical protein